MTVVVLDVGHALREAKQRLDCQLNSLPIEGDLAWRRYAALVEGNFLAWLAAAYVRCHRSETRMALHLNIMEEVIDDHPGLLRRLLVRHDLLPDLQAQTSTALILKEIRHCSAKGSPISLLAMLAYLEACSELFLPALADASDVGVDDSYIALHLRDDAAHADSLQEVLAEELLFAHEPSLELSQGIALGERLLATVFGWPYLGTANLSFMVNTGGSFIHSDPAA